MGAEQRRSGIKDVFARIRKDVPELIEAEARLGSRLVVARNVMHLRIQRGWTQTRLAEELGVRQPRVAEIEGANGNLKLDTLDALARVFSVTTASLLKPVFSPDPIEVGYDTAEAREATKAPHRLAPPPAGARRSRPHKA
jgi:transcriptional regulator with XRE-family HTH domain